MRQIAFWTFIGILDVLTDIGIMVVPIVVVYDLAVPRSKKYVIMSAFGFRILFGPQLRPSVDDNLTGLQSHRCNGLPYCLPHTCYTRRRLYEGSFWVSISHAD